jgi:uncharacterized protein YpmS
MKYILERVKEPSTWRGVFALLIVINALLFTAFVVVLFVAWRHANKDLKVNSEEETACFRA